MCVSHDGKACHSARSTHTLLFRPQKQQPKGASFCFTGGSRVTQCTRTGTYNYAGRGDTWGPPQPQVTQEFHQTPSPSAHTKRGFLSSHRPLWPASPSAPLSSLVLGSKETAASEYKEVPTALAVSVCPCYRVGLSSLGVRAGQNFSYILEGPGTTNWSLPRDRNLDTHIHTSTLTRGWKVLCKGRHYLHSVTQN